MNQESLSSPRPPAFVPSDEQRAIFRWFEGKNTPNLVVRARAGSGKTTVILAGIDRAPERSIFLCAFSKGIATELQSRLNNPRAKANTLHSEGLRAIFRTWRGVQIDNRGERARALAQQATETLATARKLTYAPDPIVALVAKLHTKAREIIPFVSHVQGLLALAARFELLPEPEWVELGWTEERVCEAALAAVALARAKTALVDFADMIFLPLVHRLTRPSYDLVVVDETQDLTLAQLKLVQAACLPHGRIAIVGDDRQAIFAFRGADSGSLDRLKRELRAQELGLTITYRCPRAVVALAREIVPDYQAAPTAPEGQVLTVKKETLFESAREGDFVLSRTNAPLAGVCMALIRRGLSARIKGRELGNGLLLRLRQLQVKHFPDLEARVEEWRTEESARLAALDPDLAAERLEALHDQADLLLALAEGLHSLPELEARIRALFVDDAERQAVMCSTVHRAKGLEAPRVFLLEGTFKSGKREEDNLRYVAITRAKAQLVWVEGFER
jgi:superfamily I DNA/RNA helicase